MTRPSRTFKLRLSPSGMDLLIDSHCHLIRSTRQLLPWGTTLHVAVLHLDTIAADRISRNLDRLATSGLSGDEVHFLGAPYRLREIACGIAGRVADLPPGRAAPTLIHIYIVALQFLLSADTNALQAAYERVAT